MQAIRMMVTRSLSTLFDDSTLVCHNMTQSFLNILLYTVPPSTQPPRGMRQYAEELFCLLRL
ncbi:hypothetical protein DSM110093_00757 [Sulfitobacter sp. DSM 110093]|nr:hypothetical protein DSM110093_00757 [Sulfitobacter sp. DSM 110093]